MKSIVSLLLFSLSLTVQAQSRFQKYFSDFLEYQQFALSPFDSTYVIAGSKWFDGSFYDFYAVKLDKNGNILWSKSFPSSNDDLLSAIAVSSTGEIFLTGHKSSNAGDFDVFLIKLNSMGDMQWAKNYGTASSEISFFGGQTKTGDFFLSGNRDVNQRPFVIKATNSGAILWSKTLGTLSGTEEGLVASITKEGGVVVFGALSSQENFLIKINPDGTTAWTNSYNSEYTQYLSSLKQTSDNGFVLASSDYRCDSSGCHSYFSFIKLDEQGVVSWARAVENYLGAGRSGIETSDGGFVFTGQLKDSMYNKAVLIKTDSKGNFLWTKAYGNSDSFGDSFFVDQTPDNGFVLLGMEDSKSYLIKTDANGNSGCKEKNLYPVLGDMNFSKSVSIVVPDTIGLDTTTSPLCADALFNIEDSLICNSSLDVKEIFNTASCSIYPNPFVESATIDIVSYSLPVAGTEFYMYDVFGRQVIQLSVTSCRLAISRGNLPDGLYFFEVRNGAKIIGNGKIVAE